MRNSHRFLLGFQVFAVYAFFLVFAQFALLARVERALGGDAVFRIMAALGICGLLTSLALAIACPSSKLNQLARWGFAALVAAGCWAYFSTDKQGFWIAAAASGIGLGLVTVSLSARLAIELERPGPVVGWGTGLAYGFCNLPWVFLAPSGRQIVLAIAIAALGGFAIPKAEDSLVAVDGKKTVSGQLVLAILALAVLVWFDSAAFFAVQHHPAWKEITWLLSGDLLRNGLTHVVAAVVAGYLFGQVRVQWLWLLAGAGLLVGYRSILAGLGQLGAISYTMGVSLYSVLLVLLPRFPGFGRNPRTVLRRSALAMAIAGWLASSLGIGMVLDLGNPGTLTVLFTALAIWAVFVAWSQSKRQLIFVAATLCIFPFLESKPPDSDLTDVERGRLVYIREGCIQCHSQYQRPFDALTGPTVPGGDIHAMRPPLIGNRRLGPDLSSSGIRRDRVWHRIHLMRPQLLVPGSRMPAYDYLFEGDDGEWLLAYLSSLGRDHSQSYWAQTQSWVAGSTEPSTDHQSLKAFSDLCAPCHGNRGRGDGPLADELAIPPRDLALDPLVTWSDKITDQERRQALARTIKFGLPGAFMPGHEYLDDSTVLGLVDLICDMRVGSQVARLP